MKKMAKGLIFLVRDEKGKIVETEKKKGTNLTRLGITSVMESGYTILTPTKKEVKLSDLEFLDTRVIISERGFPLEWGMEEEGSKIGASYVLGGNRESTTEHYDGKLVCSAAYFKKKGK